MSVRNRKEYERMFFALILGAMLSTAAISAEPDADGGYTLKERGDARNQYSIWADGSGALTSAPKGRDGYCNPQNISECGGNLDKARIQTAAAAGKLRFIDRAGKVSTYSPK